MKRPIFALLTIFALTAAGALVAQSTQNPQNPPATGTGVAPETEQGEGMDVDVDTGARAKGVVDVDVTRTTDADTDASGVDETGSLDNDANDVNTAGTAGTAGDQDALPNTASDLPLTALIGLICLGAACTVRTLAKRDA